MSRVTTASSHESRSKVLLLQLQVLNHGVQAVSLGVDIRWRGQVQTHGISCEVAARVQSAKPGPITVVILHLVQNVAKLLVVAAVAQLARLIVINLTQHLRKRAVQEVHIVAVIASSTTEVKRLGAVLKHVF